MNKIKHPVWADWFDVSGCPRQGKRLLPADCIEDCSAQGPVDDAVDYWVSELELEAPSWLLREHLREYGAWSAAELCDHQENLKRLLWTWASDCRENGADFVWLGI